MYVAAWIELIVRILATWYQFKQDTEFTNPGFGMPKDVTKPHTIVDARDATAKSVLLDGAVEGHVLVKNTNALPLQKPRLISVFGYSAKTPDFNAPASGLDLVQWQLGAAAISLNEVISGSLGTGGNYSAIGINGTLFSGCGSGATTPANSVSPFEALKARTYRDGTAMFNDFASQNPAVDPASDICIVFGNAFSCEAYDRPALLDDYTDTLIKNVANNCNNTVVVLHNAGPRVIDAFVEHANVTAIILAHLPGQDSGNALVSLLYGEANPSGKLPYTLAKKETDYAVLAPSNEGALNFPQSNFSEGVYTDYKHFDKAGIEPRYEFGFGLSYTTFDVSNANVQHVDGGNTNEYAAGVVIPGGQADLWDNIITVTANVRNTGTRFGAEVAQLYLGIPNAPIRQLRGYEKVYLQPGESRAVTFFLTRRDLSVWNVETQKWHLQRGKYVFSVGTSSRNLPLQVSLTI